MAPLLRTAAILLAAVMASGCLNGPGTLNQPGTADMLLDLARTVADARDASDVATGQARIAQGKSRLGLLEAAISGLTESPAKKDLKSAAAVLRSALNGSAYLLDSFQAMKANRTNETLVNLDAARANFTEAQRFAANVLDPDLRRAMDFGSVVAEIERTAAGLKGAE